MGHVTEWSEKQKTLTKEILETVDIIAFSFDLSGRNKGCTLNHITGSYGYITVMDAMAGRWRILDYDTDELLADFPSIDGVITGGWKVST